MKYYILDLSPQNSLVRYLRVQGFTVFMMSWKNPTEEDRELGLDDYRQLGVMAALDAVSAVVPNEKRACGGVLPWRDTAFHRGGRDGPGRRRAAQDDQLVRRAEQDFTEAGELTLFINESQVHFLEDLMWHQGYLDTKQIAGAFQLLRSHDLIWSRMVQGSLMGERAPMSGLAAWNADATRMPYRMHSEYLRQLFLNDGSRRRPLQGRGSQPIVFLTDIRAPIFAVGTERDHVAPWRSAFKVHLLTDTDVTFLLTTGGHNAGIVSEPGHGRRGANSVLTTGAQDR